MSEDAAPGRTSLARWVPASVPSLTQSSSPWTGSVRVKNSWLPAGVSLSGPRLYKGASGKVRTGTVPATVPSVFQSIQSPLASPEGKNSSFPTDAVGPSTGGEDWRRNVAGPVPSGLATSPVVSSYRITEPAAPLKSG